MNKSRLALVILSISLIVLFAGAGVLAESTPASIRPDKPEGPPPHGPEWIMEQFAALDRNSNGALSEEELSVEAEHPGHPSWSKLLAHLDVNEDGEIQEAEITAMCEEHTARRQEHFRMMDVNGDGYVSLSEFQAFRPEPKPPLRENDEFDKHRIDGEGCPPRPDMPPPDDELRPPPLPMGHDKELCFHKESMNKGERPDPAEMEAHFAQMQEEMFERLDENQDGQLQIDELKHMPHFGPPPPPLGEEFGMSKEGSSETDGSVSPASASDMDGVQPVDFCLEQNYPNPFNSLTTIAYEVPMDGHVTLAVYNVAGELVKTLVDGFQPASRYQVSMEFPEQTSGQYFCRLQAGTLSDVKKMSYIK